MLQAASENLTIGVSGEKAAEQLGNQKLKQSVTEAEGGFPSDAASGFRDAYNKFSY